jgi:hypothetical protein
MDDLCGEGVIFIAFGPMSKSTFSVDVSEVKEECISMVSKLERGGIVGYRL